ncbi:hypothetical protein [Cylindrospermum sp. FACHB-282]|nr:hypothetical protein [Cylindrospermum sp. FACHB-282]
MDFIQNLAVSAAHRDKGGIHLPDIQKSLLAVIVPRTAQVADH